MPDRRIPLLLAGEGQTLRAFLDYLRESIVRKASGLDEATSRRSTVASGTSLLGIVKHLTTVEITWFQYAFAGADGVVPSGDLDSDDTVDSVVSAYRAATVQSNRIVDDCDDLEHRCARAFRTPEPMSLRWVLVHMVEETGRHAGHADIIREQIDGQTGP
ncbi:MAG TPA: DinB family protein [Acidimicrobiales bacterium]|nr:DinB family protein [Acidimicrobiales bacterium]